MQKVKISLYNSTQISVDLFLKLDEVFVFRINDDEIFSAGQDTVQVVVSVGVNQ